MTQWKTLFNQNWGFCFEIGKKALNINSKQSNNPITASGSVLKAKYKIIKHVNPNYFSKQNLNTRLPGVRLYSK